MAKITASLSARTDVRGKSEILLRFVSGRDHVYRLHSRIFIQPSRWKDGAVVLPRLETGEQKELKETKAKLSGLEAFLLDEFHAADRQTVTRQWMQEAVDRFHHPDGSASLDFFKLFREFRDSRDISHYRHRHYGTVINSLERFEAYRGKPLKVDGVDASVLQDYKDFLTREYLIAKKKRWRTLYATDERPPEPRSHNTVIDFLKILRAFYNWLGRTGLTASDPFRTFEIGTATYGTPWYITIGERERIYKTNLRRHPSLAAQRDVFVFQCLVGCRVGDLVELKKEDVVDGVLVYVQRKTLHSGARTIRVPLTGTAKEIVGRYADLPGKKLLPFTSQQQYNRDIKRIFLAAGLTRPVSVLDPVTRREVKRPLNEVASSHLARRTFVGNLYKQVKDQNLVGALSGHGEGSRAFARYRDIDDEVKAGVVGLLEVKEKGEKF